MTLEKSTLMILVKRKNPIYVILICIKLFIFEVIYDKPLGYQLPHVYPHVIQRL